MISKNEALQAQVRDLTTELVKKDANIVMLKAELAKGPREGPDAAELKELREVNAQLSKGVKSLTQ